MLRSALAERWRSRHFDTCSVSGRGDGILGNTHVDKMVKMSVASCALHNMSIGLDEACSVHQHGCHRQEDNNHLMTKEDDSI